MIFRYLNSSLFLSQLIRSEISFSPLTKLDDPTEGQLKNFSFFEKVVFGGRNKIQAEKERNFEKKRITSEMLEYYVSCWTVNNNEDYALWNIFTDKVNGLIIISTIDKLLSSISQSNKIYHQGVKYIPYNEKTFAKSFSSTQERIFTKLDFYKYEEEYRFAIRDKSDRGNNQSDLRYLSIPADFSNLILKVILSPFMSDMSKEYFKETLYRINPEISNRIVNSSIRLSRSECLDTGKINLNC